MSNPDTSLNNPNNPSDSTVHNDNSDRTNTESTNSERTNSENSNSENQNEHLIPITDNKRTDNRNTNTNNQHDTNNSAENSRLPENNCCLLSKNRGCGTFLLGLTIFYWVFSFICCAGMLFVGWEMGRTVRQGITENPEEIRAQTRQFYGPITIPEQFKPATALTFKQPFSGKPVFFGAVYAYSNPNRDEAISDVITLGVFSDYLSEELRDSFQKKLTDEIVLNDQTRTILQNKTVAVSIDGQSYQFQSVLSADANGNQLLTFSGLFRNASDEPAFILVSTDPKVLSEQQIIQMLQ